MPLIQAASAPIFTLEGTTITGLASPSRGSTEISSWRIRLEPGVAVPAHVLSREEVFVILAGAAVAQIDGEQLPLGAGDSLAVPPGRPFSLTVTGSQPFEAVVSMAVGGEARMVAEDGPFFTPPWVQ
jgi:mannose-6-phosphate isomerase-like protein (cupin superfamily)